MRKCDFLPLFIAPAFFLFSIVLSAQNSGELLDPLSQTKFVNKLPVPSVMEPATPGGSHYEVSISQFKQDLGLVSPVAKSPLMTTVWGYNGSFPGPTIETRTDSLITVLWKNELLDDLDNPLPHFLPVDTTLHWANPQGWPNSGIPVVTHLHGGHTESASDGLPEAWYTPGFTLTGPGFVKQTFTYDNDQQAATLWYHDHAMGITRLNVYAGLAGFYIIRDENEDALNLPSGDYEIPLVIQDRMFYSDGELYYPSEPEIEGMPNPSALPEFFGDIILVNGKAWPVLDVERRKYRFRFLNGSDSRFYNMWLTSEQKFYQIGSDGGLLNAPVEHDTILMAPGERFDIILDFSDPSLAGQTIMLRNDAEEPFPFGLPVDSATAGLIMAFKVATETVADNSVIPSNLRPNDPVQSISLDSVDTTRELVLFEGQDEHERLQPLLGTLEDGPLRWSAPITENPMLNDYEVWKIINATPDAHPVHLHLVFFQIIDRQTFDAESFEHYNTVVLTGSPKIPPLHEKGWKDTGISMPGEVMRVIAKFDREGRYVWHCHILSHEDNEMMRPFHVGEIPVSIDEINREIVIGNDKLDQNYPNPFSDNTTINFHLDKDSYVELRVLNAFGQEVAYLLNNSFKAGQHTIIWNGADNSGNRLASGNYFYQLKTDKGIVTKKMNIIH